ncbi:hypothetical protein EAG18_03975 [Pseudoalteromonas sp. J010]|uniref:oligosaccharide flippase family protein n=1 Tax=Pseudoalteromonas sp. J010 TaxID=998465 RepID=UPI000F64997F|nr:oligosaccharide flippase family protein [Pseudoalteromonas sp. J010]RRS10097.1 hypothetical protein EAG18_03975 [Pseudoalteromonas sp. J010]
MGRGIERANAVMVTIRSTVKGLSWSAFATIIKAVIQFAVFILLARSLSLNELGIVAFITLLISISQLLSDAGISNALIYFDNLTLSVKKQLYCLGLGIIVLISLLISVTLPQIEIFFGIEGLANYQVWIAVILLLRALSAQPLAIMQKQLLFKNIAFLEVSAAFISLAALGYALYLKLGVSAALLAHSVNAAVMAIVTTFICKKDIGFSIPKYQSIKAPLRYGLYQSAESILSFVGRQFDQLVVAKMMGAEVLGVYSYIKELVAKPALQFINPIVNRVAFPSLVKLKRQARGALYTKLMLALGCINIPLYVGIYYYAEFVIQLTFGESWYRYSDIVSIMAITMLFTALINPCGPLLQASGAVRRSFLWNLLVTVKRAVIIVIMVQHGLKELVIALAILQSIVFLLHWPVLVTPFTDLQFINFIKSQLPALSFTTVAMLSSLLLYQHFNLPMSQGVVLYMVFLLLCMACTLFLLRSRLASLFMEVNNEK